MLLPVRALPGARRAGLTGIHDGALSVATTAPPANGEATIAIARLLATALGVPRTAVQCVAGAGSRRKRFRVDGLDLQTCRRRLREGLA